MFSTIVNKLQNFKFRVVNSKKLEKDIELKIVRAIEESRDFSIVGEGDRIMPSNQAGFDGVSIYEENIFDQDEESNKKLKYKGYDIAEGRFFSQAGFNVGVNTENEQDIGRLRIQQDSSLYQYINYPIARSIIENVKRYVIGRGLKFDCCVPEVLAFINNFWSRNNMELRNKNAYKDFLIQGELFWLFYKNRKFEESSDTVYDTPLILRQMNPSLVEDIELDEDDFENILSYEVQNMVDDGKDERLFFLDAFHPVGDEVELGLPSPFNDTKSEHFDEAEKDVKMLMFKYGTTFDVRGRVFMEPVLRWNRLYTDFVYDRGRINHLRTKVFLIETRTAQGTKVLGTSFEKLPKGGMKLIETGDRKFRFEEPKTGASDAAEDGRLIGYLIGSGVSIPLHILLQNAENENYASIKEAGGPFAQMIQDFQDDWRCHITRMFRYVLAEGVRMQILDSEYKIYDYSDSTIGEMKDFIARSIEEGTSVANIVEDASELFSKEERVVKTVDVPIHIIFPDIVHTDPKVQAEVIKIYRELGLMSNHTAMTKIGLQPETERIRIEKEDEIRFEKQQERIKSMDAGSLFKDENEEPEDEKDEDKSDDEEK